MARFRKPERTPEPIKFIPRINKDPSISLKLPKTMHTDLMAYVKERDMSVAQLVRFLLMREMKSNG